MYSSPVNRWLWNISTDSFENTPLPSIIIKLNGSTYGSWIPFIMGYLIFGWFSNKKLWKLDGNDVSTIIIIENKFVVINCNVMASNQIEYVLTEWHQMKTNDRMHSRMYSLNLANFALSGWCGRCSAINLLIAEHKLMSTLFLK